MRAAILACSFRSDATDLSCAEQVVTCENPAPYWYEPRHRSERKCGSGPEVGRSRAGPEVGGRWATSGPLPAHSQPTKSARRRKWAGYIVKYTVTVVTVILTLRCLRVEIALGERMLSSIIGLVIPSRKQPVCKSVGRRMCVFRTGGDSRFTRIGVFRCK